MKEPPHPALAQGKVRYVGDRGRLRRSRKRSSRRASAADAMEVDYEVLPAVVGVLDAIKPGAPLCSTMFRTISAATGRSATRRRPTPRSARPRMSPRSAWSTIGWSAIRWSRARRSANTTRRRGHYTMWTTSQFPHVVQAADGQLRAQHPAAQIADRGARRRRRLRREAVPLCRGSGHHLGVARKSAGRSNGSASAAKAFISDAQGRDHVTEAELALDENGKFLGLRVNTHRQHGRLHFDLRSQHSDQSLRTAAGRRLSRRPRSIAK